MLLLVDDQQPEVAELNALAEQRMGADHDVDRAVLDAGLDAGQLGGADQRDAWPTLSGKPLNRSENVLKCWRARASWGQRPPLARRSSRR
jgi:hypothetical protein